MASSSVIAALGGATVETLLRGGVPDPGTLGSVASALISEILRAEDLTPNALARIEAKVDQQLNQAYVGPLRVAAAHLRAANAAHRTPKQRERMLADARTQVMTARAAAADDVAAARAEWSLAVIWFASASVEDSREALERGAALATRAAVNAIGAFRQPVWDQVKELARERRSAVDRIGLGGSRAEEKAVAELRDEAAGQLDEALAVLDGLYAELDVLGSPSERRPTLDVIGVDGPARSVRLAAFGGAGTNVVGDLRVRLISSVGRRPNAIDIHVELSANADGPDLAVAFYPLHRRRIQGPPLPAGRLEQHLAPIPGNALGFLPTTRRPATKRVAVPAGQTSRGWASLICLEPRAGTTHRADHVSLREFVAVQLTISPLVRQGRGPRSLGFDTGSLDLVLPLPVRSRGRASPLAQSPFAGTARSTSTSGVRVRPLRPRPRT